MKISRLLEKEFQRQNESLQLIPSENYTSKAVRDAVGSVAMHKYSEGQIGKRYYEGNSNIDRIEEICKTRALDVFELDKNEWHVNVQALSGSIANLAVYNALLEPGKDKIMSMYLFDGGHLSHGWKYKNRKVTLSSKLFESVYYHVDPETGEFDYDEVSKIARRENPSILISGGTAYPREIDHRKLAKIAHSIDAFYLADIAHEAGLVAGKANKSPFKHADVVTMTTHKTLRGPRGALIFCREEFSKKIDRSVFPGLQGGPFNNNIAGIAVALKEAQTEEFSNYAEQVVKNAKTLAEELKKNGFKLISDGTDKHLILINISTLGVSSSVLAYALNTAGITLNKNTIPNEPNSPMNPSGLRLGTPTATTRGMKEEEIKLIAQLFNEAIETTVQIANDNSEADLLVSIENSPNLATIRNGVRDLCLKYPLEG